MSLRRRDFLATSSGSLLGVPGGKPAQGASSPVAAQQTVRSFCTACSIGCHTRWLLEDGRVAAISGDPDDPVSEGSLCARGLAQTGLFGNRRRITRVQYRRAGGAAWEEKRLAWAIDRMAEKVKGSHQAGKMVAVLAGRTLGAEQRLRVGDLSLALGANWYEDETACRLRPTSLALEATFGPHYLSARSVGEEGSGGKGTAPAASPRAERWMRLAAADAVLVIGANPAESHPLAMKWLLRGRDDGGTIIAVDPRLTRTAAMADFHVSVRPGTDLAFLGGLIRHIVAGGFVAAGLAARSDVACLVDPEFEFVDGRFGPIEAGRYTAEHWDYQRDDEGAPLVAPSLDHADCVYQQLRRHFDRYTPEAVAQICGTPTETLQKVYNAYAEAAGKPHGGLIVYSGGLTEQMGAAQAVRALGIVQLLLANGRDGDRGLVDLALPATGWHGYEGQGASGDKQPGLFEAMADGRVGGLVLFEANPAVARGNAEVVRQSLGLLDWLVVADAWETETAAFWKRSGVSIERIDTEVFLLPALSAAEMELAAIVPPVGEAVDVQVIAERLEKALAAADKPTVQQTHEQGGRMAAGARLFAPLADGPFPEYYEPLESVAENCLSPQQANPLAERWLGAAASAAEYPVVATLFGIGEHSGSGSSSRNLARLAEMVPEAFLEMGVELAAEHAIQSGDRVTVTTARGQITLLALVTPRLRRFDLGGKPVDQVGLLKGFGFQGLAVGETAHVLAPWWTDPASGAQACRAFLCRIEKASRRL